MQRPLENPRAKTLKMPPLASLCDALDSADWLQTLAENASVLTALDAFFSQACAVQAKRLELSTLPDNEIRALHDDGRVAFALYMRLLREMQSNEAPLKPAVMTAMRGSLLHVARLLPFCQLFGLRNPQRVRLLVNAALSNVEATQADLKQLCGVYVSHFEKIHHATGLNKRPQVVDLIQSIYEASLSIHTLASSSSALELLFGSNESETLASDSLLRALAVCYEADLPVLQRNLSKLDDKAQKRAALLVPESRRLLLQILDSVLQHAMDQERAAGGSGESVLTFIHDLSHSTEAETTDHGSFVSDLWHLCGKEAKLLEYFGQVDLDRDSVSYLEVVLEGLPRRRVVDEAPQEGKKQTAQAVAHQREEVEGVATVDATTAAAASAVDMDSLISQVRDLFPDLGDGYVALCLLSSQHELETVINYLLESNPPPALSGVSTSLKQSDNAYAALERKALGKEPLEAAAPQTKSEKVDPTRIWKGKRAQEKHYDPQVARKDPSIVEKVKQIVDEYAEEENFLEAAREAINATSNGKSNSGDGGFVLDEYDDDYNDEYEDYEPFSVHDGGQAEDFDAIRLQNRRLRALEAEDAFWEGMRNQNRRAVDVEDGDEDDEGEDESKEETTSSSQWARGPARGEWKPSAQQTNAGPRGGGGSRGGGRGGSGGAEAGTPGGPMTEQQLQRQRQRDSKNKAKVGNHHRKDRALKKRG